MPLVSVTTDRATCAWISDWAPMMPRVRPAQNDQDAHSVVVPDDRGGMQAGSP